jgi:hypothetical protein
MRTWPFFDRSTSTKSIMNKNNLPDEPSAAALWQQTINELLLVREQLDRVTRIVHRLSPRLDTVSFQADRAEAIQKWVCARYDVRYAAICSKSRRQHLVRPRWLAIYLIDKFCPGLTLDAKGALFGGRDHGTIINAIRTLQNYASVDPKERQFLDTLTADCAAFLDQQNLTPIPGLPAKAA